MLYVVDASPGEQLHVSLQPRLILEINASERLAPAILHDEARVVVLLDRPWRREAAGLHYAAGPLERLAEADILLVEGQPPNSDYRFKHALIQDAAYENMLKSRRQVLHRCVGEVVGDQFAAIAVAQPELLAHHFTQAGLIEAAIEWWGKAGRRSLEHSALVEATAQLTHALDQIAALPPNPALRREQIKLQVALIKCAPSCQRLCCA